MERTDLAISLLLVLPLAGFAVTGVAAAFVGSRS
jgi:hypothetical protein